LWFSILDTDPLTGSAPSEAYVVPNRNLFILLGGTSDGLESIVTEMQQPSCDGEVAMAMACAAAYQHLTIIALA
jgi:hypothetical protein